MNLLEANGLFTVMLTFNELSNRKEPMSRYMNKAVFGNTKNGSKVELNHTYFCSLFEVAGKNCYFADILGELDAEELYLEHKDEIIEVLFNKHRDLMEADITECQNREIEERVARKYAKKIANLESQIKALERNKEVEIKNTEPINENILEGSVLRTDFLRDGFYSARYNITRSKLLLFRDDEGEIVCRNGTIDLDGLEEPFSTKNTKVKLCEYLDGVMIESYI